MKQEKSLFLVPWIEIEYGWGDRFEGYKVFDNKEKMISSTLEDSENGNYEGGGGYFGPLRPLNYYESPFDESILKKGWIKDLPKFHSNMQYIKDDK